MASTFKNKFARPTTGEVAFAFAGAQGAIPAGSVITVIGLTCANTSTNNSRVTIRVYDQFNGTGYYIVKDAPVPVGSTLSVLDGKLILQAGNIITVSTPNASSIDAVLSYMEIS